ncbi:MAG: hypothetical protein COB59_05075 [Rhodospirillaceae bacterium]|nr:MAG: hypothetical protein COB59_05075 [Rhodospirillaceae bacterium]
MHTYEITIYNKTVRELVHDGESHKRYTDDWADSHYIEFEANSEAEAVEKCGRKYPGHDGFIIEQVALAA